MRILILDDDKIVVKLVHMALEPEGYFVNSVNTIDGAIRAIKNDPPDLLLLDINLQTETAYDYLKQRALDNELKSVPVFIISSSNQQMDILTTAVQGASNYLLKPLNKKILVDKIGQLAS